MDDKQAIILFFKELNEGLFSLLPCFYIRTDYDHFEMSFLYRYWDGRKRLSCPEGLLGGSLVLWDAKQVSPMNSSEKKKDKKNNANNKNDFLIL